LPELRAESDSIVLMDRNKVLGILLGSAVLAGLMTWLLLRSVTAPKTEKLVKAAAAARDLPAGTKLKKGDVRMVTMAERDVPPAAFRDEKGLEDRTLVYPVGTNRLITTAELSTVNGVEGVPAVIEHGKRAVAVQINDSAGAAGLIQPRAHVDVLFTRPGSMSEALTATILQNVVVLSIGRTIEVTAPDPKAQRPQNYSVTLLVTPEEAAKLELAKNQGKISLALRNPLDKSTVEDPMPTTGEVLDPLIYARMSKSARARMAAMKTGAGGRNFAAALASEDEDEKKAKKPEPPKPRAVVEVFRGDKHVQEIFHDKPAGEVYRGDKHVQESLQKKQ